MKNEKYIKEEPRPNKNIPKKRDKWPKKKFEFNEDLEIEFENELHFNRWSVAEDAAEIRVTLKGKWIVFVLAALMLVAGVAALWWFSSI